MKILLADDHDLLRDTIKSFLEVDGAFAVMTAADLGQAIELLANEPGFDLVLLDYSMPGMNGFDGLERALATAPGTPVALISGTAPPRIAQQALDRGASGFLPKTLPAKSLANAIRLMADGERYVPIDIAMAAIAGEDSAPGAAILTLRERQVLVGLCEGKANKEIARDLDLREPTIKLHVKAICRKLDARNRTHAALLARNLGLA